MLKHSLYVSVFDFIYHVTDRLAQDTLCFYLEGDFPCDLGSKQYWKKELRLSVFLPLVVVLSSLKKPLNRF